MKIYPDFCVLVSADTEWKVTKKLFPKIMVHHYQYGEWFVYKYFDFPELNKSIHFIHGGWGKVSAAASAQYVINKWHPKMIINLGTCGGFEGEIKRGEIILVEKTIIYDIYEQMGDPKEHINQYITEIDNSWLTGRLPLLVKRILLLSGDRDLVCNEISALKSQYKAVAGDWESGAIAWVANRNKTHCLILRGVTDLVNENVGQAYGGNAGCYYENTNLIMKKLIESLPKWLLKYKSYYSSED